MSHFGTKPYVVACSACQCKQSFAHFSTIPINIIPQPLLEIYGSHQHLTPSQMACASSATRLNGHELDFPNGNQARVIFPPFRYPTRLRISRKAT